MTSRLLVGLALLVIAGPARGQIWAEVVPNPPVDHQPFTVTFHGGFPNLCHHLVGVTTEISGPVLRLEIAVYVPPQSYACALVFVDYEVDAVFPGVPSGVYQLTVVQDYAGVYWPDQVVLQTPLFVDLVPTGERASWGAIKSLYR